jgi:TPR repeat protein
MRITPSCIALLIAGCYALGLARADAVESFRSVQFEDIPADVMTDGFLEAHPDLLHRRNGMRRDEAGNFEGARKQYRLAARYGDKPSQARLGEMYWTGEGGEQDRATGYLWMALAAERNYTEFVNWKLYYWGQLTEAEKQKAKAHDQQMLAEYGDAAAKPRQAAVMRREMHKATGSMLGPGSGAALFISTPEGRGISAERFYARQFWSQDEYWTLQDKMWGGALRGHVTVGDVEDISADPASDESKADPAKP